MELHPPPLARGQHSELARIKSGLAAVQKFDLAIRPMSALPSIATIVRTAESHVASLVQVPFVYGARGAVALFVAPQPSPRPGRPAAHRRKCRVGPSARSGTRPGAA